MMLRSRLVPSRLLLGLAGTLANIALMWSLAPPPL
jgi:hypothetical protein